MTIADELRHLDRGPRAGEVPGGFDLLAVEVTTSIDATEFLTRCKDVLRIVLAMTTEEMAAESTRPAKLPDWFVRACAPEESEEEKQRWLVRWRGLGPDDKARVEREKGWTLRGWLEWMEPDDRLWHWWDAVVKADREVQVILQVSDWPAAVGALEWLLRASGATDILIDEESEV